MQFVKQNGLAVAVDATGLKVIAYAYGCQCGTQNKLPVGADEVVTIYTALQRCNIAGEPVDSREVASNLTVRIPVSELAGVPIWGENGFSPEVVDIYIDKLVEMTTPPVEEV